MTLQQPQQHKQPRHKHPSVSATTAITTTTTSTSSAPAPRLDTSISNNNSNSSSANLNRSVDYRSNNTTAFDHHSSALSSPARPASDPSVAEKEQALASLAPSIVTGNEGSSSSGSRDARVSRDQDNLSQSTRSDQDQSPATEPQQELNTEESPGIGTGEGSGSPATSFARITARCQDHLKLFFSMHHKLFDLVAFYVVMFAINGQMTSLPTRLEWIGFCVQSIVALRRAFQTSIKHGIGLTSFLGMLDLLVGQLFLHQDRLGLLPTVANILVYFYVINLTRGLVFGDSVSCLLWFLFGLIDIYRKDPSSASILDLTPYKVIPVHTVGFGLYILMSELVDVMLQSAEPDPIQGRHLHYVGAQKGGPVSIRSSSRRSSTRSMDPSNNLRFELCITEITPFTVSFCLNAVSDAPLSGQTPEQDAVPNNISASGTIDGSAAGETTTVSDTVDLSTIKIGSATNSSSSLSGHRQSKSRTAPRIISTSDIVIHVNYIPWQQVQYHFPDEQSFTLYGLTPSTDYEIEMRVHQFSSFVTRIGTRAASPGTPIPTKGFEKTVTKQTETAPKNNKNRKSKKNQRNQRDIADRSGDLSKSKASATTATSASTSGSTSGKASETTTSNSGTLVCTESAPQTPTAHEDLLSAGDDKKNSNQLLFEQLRKSIHASVEAASATKAALKKLKRDQSKVEASLRQELEGIGRGQAKALVQDQKRRQKLSFLQESIKQADAQSSTLQEDLVQLRSSALSSQPQLDQSLVAIRALEQKIQSSLVSAKAEVAPLKAECQRLQSEIKQLESERADWTLKATKLRESEVAPLQLRLQRLEQQQVVWKVAAEASKDKDREAGLKLAALEEEIQKKTLKSQQLENAIEEFKKENIVLKESVEQEMEIWESLERELDEDESPTSSFPLQPPSYGTQYFTSPGPAPPVLQPLHHQQLDMSVDSSLRDSHYWFPAGNGIGSSSDPWLNPASPLIGGGVGVSSSDGHARSRTLGLQHNDPDSIVSEPQSLWEMPSIPFLDGTRSNTNLSNILAERE
ncbi:hypothetical protein BC939DRAFT_438354 [Gamsiella multidivaricata]|uniref:uncharacterized protein n=1 Tax=Gamsiella multidivaricata TaxID=101098 RepID=UPI00221E9A84|nr:uncharacterized protein BC939DRAFT_438354 [Gamsiella multidivaricata]KAG0368020.1 hypothetical protein BGZ54_002830 [Gamsiella multidivaricata]KAI7830568.1 hypothetical protein BC939DRAFT_438354 [Gamsiella multidivaricata]